MGSDKQGFPDDIDRQLQREAERVWLMADDLVEWAGRHVAPRQATEFAISPEEEFSLYRLRRMASNLCRSSNVPVAAAVYGPSQVGKSLFVGRVLDPADSRDCPLGKSDQVGPPAYIRDLSFEYDLNPNSGDIEATALVTRFTTKERFDETALPEYPVKVRSLTRAEWLRVLARGFRSECKQTGSLTWREAEIRALFEETAKAHAADVVDRDWRMDLLDVYAYIRRIDQRMYEIPESMFNSFLSQYPLTDAGYVEIAGRLFWECRRFPSLTTLFNDVTRFIQKVTSQGRDGILVHWAAVKFLLDSQQSMVQAAPNSKWKQQVSWKDLTGRFENGWYVLNYEPGGGGPTEDLATIQSAMLEMIIPIIPHRLKDDWRDVIQKMDILDLPGMRSGKSDSTGGAEKIESNGEKMNVVKRGKVFYLIDRYIEERQVQTLLLLISGRNLEVRQLLKEYVDKWGQSRYGEDAWPTKITPSPSSFFIGMTGIDIEFANSQPNPNLYDNRIKQLVDATLYEIMRDYGGPGQPFTDIHPIRYSGTWDMTEAKRQVLGPQKWTQAKQYFLESPLVRQYVRNPEQKWDLAMDDSDGGLSLVCQGFIAGTSSLQKQDSLAAQIKHVDQDIRSLAIRWYCNPDANADREKRLKVVQKVLDWLMDEHYVYDRVYAIQHSLSFEEGDALELAELAEVRPSRSMSRPQPLAERFPGFLKEQLNYWARELATKRWREYCEDNDGGTTWLPAEDFNLFVRYLCDYLCSDQVFTPLADRLLSVVNLSVNDAGDRRHAQREYVRVILNDYVLTPGPHRPLATNGHSTDERNFGLMEQFVRRWEVNMPEAIASVAGEYVKIPSGNDELEEIVKSFTN